MDSTVDVTRGDDIVIRDGGELGNSSSTAPSSPPSLYGEPSSPKLSKGSDAGAALAGQDSSLVPPSSETPGQLELPSRALSEPPSRPLRSLSTSLASSPGVARPSTAIPPPSSMPLAASMAPGSMVAYVRANPQGAWQYGTKHTGTHYPYTQPQNHPPYQQAPYPLPPSSTGGSVMARQPSTSAAALQRANSAPPTRAFSQRRSVAVSSHDWQAGSGSVDPTSPGRTSEPEEAPTGSVVKPYGYLPEPVTPPPLKPRWPTARLVSSRRSAASAFTSFSTAPTGALRITSFGHSSGNGGGNTAAATANPNAPATAVAAVPSARSSRQQSDKAAAKLRFTNSRARCLADNLAFLYRGNTYNPPINERITRLFEVVLPPPSAATVALRAVPSPMTPPPPPAPPPPEATLHLDRALQQRRDAVVAQRNLVEGDAAAATMDRWSSRRRNGVQGQAMRSLSINAPWLGRSGDYWADSGSGCSGVDGTAGYGGFCSVGGGSMLHRGASPIPVGTVSIDGLAPADVAARGVWSEYAPEYVAASAAAAADAVRQSGSEALHLQGVSYKAAKAATRALAHIHRPGISLRVRAKVEDEPPPSPWPSPPLPQPQPLPLPHQPQQPQPQPQTQPLLQQHPHPPPQPPPPQSQYHHHHHQQQLHPYPQHQQHQQKQEQLHTHAHPQQPSPKGAAATVWV